MRFEKEFMVTFFLISLILGTMTVVFYGRMQDALEQVTALRRDNKALKSINQNLMEMTANDTND